MAKPRKIVHTAAQTEAYLDYSKIHNDSVAAQDWGISSPKSLRDWRAMRLQLEKGKVHQEVQKINASVPRILNTVSTKGKSTEKEMLYFFPTTFRKTDARHFYTLDGAPPHMHASSCIALALLLFFMYISPPNTTPWCQGCDKAHINKAFGNFLTEFFTQWLCDKVDNLRANEKVPMPDRHEMAKWTRDSWEKVGDDALRAATLAAYFPDGLKFLHLLDSAYFREHEDEQGSSSSSDSKSDSHSHSGSGSVISSTDDDSSGGDFDAPGSARHADGGAESDASSLTSAEELPDAPTPNDDSDLNCDTEVVWVKSARGVWGMGHGFRNQLYFTRDIPERKWVPKNLLTLAKPPTKKAKPPPKSAAQSIPVESGEHVQEFKVKWSKTKKLYTKPVKE